MMTKLFLLATFILISTAKIEETSGFVTVAIAASNDIHGSAFPTTLYRSDTNETYNYGGLVYMASMIETLRKQYKGNFLYLDAGDQFQGGIEASPLVSSGQIMNDFFNQISVDSSAVGNHEFDFGPNFLFDYWSNRKDGSLNLAANIVSEKGTEEFLPKQKNSWLYELESGLKIGVVGLATKETPSSSGAFSDKMFPAYQFLDYADIVMRESRQLKEKGADAVLILSHMGNNCDADSTYGQWFETTTQTSVCNFDDEMSQLLEKIPVGTVDGVIQGHRHKFSHHYIRGVPVLGTINGGFYFNVLYLHFYNKHIYQTYIEGPIPVCQNVFKKTRNCKYLSPFDLKSAGPLVGWQFHGQKVQAHKGVEYLFNSKWLPKMSGFFESLVLNQVVLERTFDGQTMLGNLITDLMDMAYPDNDFVLMNSGGFRTIWYPGVLQFQHFYNMFPFPNRLVSFQMTGYELIQTLKVLQNGKKGFYPSKKLKQQVFWHKNGTKQLKKVVFSDGCEIELGRNYRGLSIDFLMSGGDDFQNVIGSIYTLRKQTWLGQFRDSLKPQLVRMGLLTESKLIDANNPRIVVQYEIDELDEFSHS